MWMVLWGGDRLCGGLGLSLRGVAADGENKYDKEDGCLDEGAMLDLHWLGWFVRYGPVNGRRTRRFQNFDGVRTAIDGSCQDPTDA